MLQYLMQRIGLALLVCVAVSLLAFTLLNASGDVAISMAGEEASAAQIDAMREQMGLNRPVLVRYGEWLGNAVQGDFGNSLFFRQPVAELIADRLPRTLRRPIAVEDRIRRHATSGTMRASLSSKLWRTSSGAPGRWCRTAYRRSTSISTNTGYESTCARAPSSSIPVGPSF